MNFSKLHLNKKDHFDDSHLHDSVNCPDQISLWLDTCSLERWRLKTIFSQASRKHLSNKLSSHSNQNRWIYLLQVSAAQDQPMYMREYKKTAFVETRCHIHYAVLNILLIRRLTSDRFPSLHRWCRASILMASKLRGSFCNSLMPNKGECKETKLNTCSIIYFILQQE